MPETVKLNIDGWKIRFDERSRGRMKFQIKLNKDETEAFKAFTDTVKPEEVALDDFVKSIFLTGIESMNKKLVEMVKKYAEEHKDDLSASGIEIVE